MTQTKQKKQHQHWNPPPHKAGEKAKKTINAVLVVMFLFLLIGIGITYFAVGGDPKSLMIGGVISLVAGYFFGRLIINGLTKK